MGESIFDYLVVTLDAVVSPEIAVGTDVGTYREGPTKNKGV